MTENTFTLNVLSFNLWADSFLKHVRSKWVHAHIAKEKPDIILFQEVSNGTVIELTKKLRKYDYKYKVTYLRSDPPPIKGPRILGHWMVLLRLATQMLENTSDPYVEEIAERSVDAIMNYHYNPAYGLMNEVINHDLSRTDDDSAQFSYTGHAIETLWMVLYEAVRLKDKQLFDHAAEYFKRHIEVSWDDVYGGAFRCLDHVDNNIWKTDKVLWLQEEILIGTMFII